MMQRQTCQFKSQGLVGRKIQGSLFKVRLVKERLFVRPITDDSVLPFRSSSSAVLARRLLINSLKFPSTLSSDISFSIRQIFIDMMLAELGYNFWSIFLKLVKLFYFLFHSYKLMFLFLEAFSRSDSLGLFGSLIYVVKREKQHHILS